MTRQGSQSACAKLRTATSFWIAAARCSAMQKACSPCKNRQMPSMSTSAVWRLFPGICLYPDIAFPCTCMCLRLVTLFWEVADS